MYNSTHWDIFLFLDVFLVKFIFYAFRHVFSSINCWNSNLLSKMYVLIGVQPIKIRHLIKKGRENIFPSNFSRFSLSFVMSCIILIGWTPIKTPIFEHQISFLLRRDRAIFFLLLWQQPTTNERVSI